MPRKDHLDIFLVEDDSFFKEMFSYHFSNMKEVEIHTFDNGEDCITNLFLEPDMVILDYVLNLEDLYALNGLQVLMKVKEFDRKIPVVMISAEGTQDFADKAIDSGADYFIAKDEQAFSKMEKLLEDKLAGF